MKNYAKKEVVKTLAPKVAKVVSQGSPVVEKALIDGTQIAQYQLSKISDNIVNVNKEIVDNYITLLDVVQKAKLEEVNRILENESLSPEDKKEFYSQLNQKEENIHLNFFATVGGAIITVVFFIEGRKVINKFTVERHKTARVKAGFDAFVECYKYGLDKIENIIKIPFSVVPIIHI